MGSGAAPVRPPQIRFGPFCIDPTSGELRKGGIVVKLQPQPFRVLRLLAERAGQVVDREEIRRQLWNGETFVDFDRSINFCVNQIRAALSDDAEKPRYVETLPRRGYRFIATVSEAAELEVVTPSRPAQLTREKTNLLPALSSSTFVGQPVRTNPEPGMYRKLWVWVWVFPITLVVAMGVDWIFHRVAKTSSLAAHDMEISKLTNQGNVAYVAISPDGRYIVYALRDKGGLGLWTRQVGTHSDIQVLPAEPADFRGITFSPDGTYIFFPHCLTIGRCDLYSMPVLGGTPRLLIKDVDAPISFSPGGKQFVFVRADSKQNVAEVRIANSDGANERLLTTIDHAGATWQGGGAWSPDGRTLALAVQFRGDRPGGELDTISLGDGTRRTVYSDPTWDQVGHPQWLPEGDGIVVVAEDRAGRGQIWTVPYPRGEARPLTHDLEDYHPYLDITRDGKTIVANAWTITINLFALPDGDFSRMQQITFGQQQLDAVVVGPDARLLVHENANLDGELWAMSADGSHRVLFSTFRDTSSLARCGRFVAFTAKGRLMRTDADGLNPREMVNANVLSPFCASDGRFVFYIEGLPAPERIMRIPIEGGAPTEIAKAYGEGLVGPVVISADGKFLAYASRDSKKEPSVRLVVMRSEGGAPLKTFPGIYGYVRWSPDGRALDYFNVRDGVVQIMEQPLSGGEPRELTRFASGRTYGFNWSPDGKRLYIPHGDVKSDAVLISNFR
jgi:Tol biopolymer transport system component/DNA-binding winged helix-turn-helix (wHTH) protein